MSEIQQTRRPNPSDYGIDGGDPWAGRSRSIRPAKGLCSGGRRSKRRREMDREVAGALQRPWHRYDSNWQNCFCGEIALANRPTIDPKRIQICSDALQPTRD